jgi:hypothetical protein
MGVCIFEVWTSDLDWKNQNSKLFHKTFEKNGEDGGGLSFRGSMEFAQEIERKI